MATRHSGGRGTPDSAQNAARDRRLESAPPFPGPEELQIEGLSDAEEARFLAAIADA